MVATVGASLLRPISRGSKAGNAFAPAGMKIFTAS
jgi:hypothetical protein